MEAGRDHDASKGTFVWRQRNARYENLPTIHFPAHVLDHVLQVGFRFRTIADQLIQIVSTRGPSTF
jgi:hypothetical protein